MMYRFKCKACDIYYDEFREVKDCSVSGICELCSKPTIRVITSPLLSFGNWASAMTEFDPFRNITHEDKMRAMAKDDKDYERTVSNIYKPGPTKSLGQIMETL